jgi:hypothetical protein
MKFIEKELFGAIRVARGIPQHVCRQNSVVIVKQFFMAGIKLGKYDIKPAS